MPFRDRIENLAEGGINSLYSIYNNAPLLRHINPNNIYNQIPNNETASDPTRTRTIDGHVVHVGEANDGVFSNMSAKPTTNPTPVADQLPSYEDASLDPTPPYWETSIMSEFDDVYIDGIPVGNVFNFLWSLLVSVLFQFLGFVITYLLHTSHAAKNGSQFGLGITIINLGFASLPIDINKHEIQLKTGKFEPMDPSTIDVSIQNGPLVGYLDGYQSSLSSHGDYDNASASLLKGTPFLAYSLFVLGGYIIVKAVYDFVKVKRLEFSIMNPISSNVVTPEDTNDVADQV